MQNNLVNLEKVKNLKRAKMIAAILITVTILSIIIWNNIINREVVDIKIPSSDNNTFKELKALSPSNIVEQIESYEGKPILLYIYTTWCGICKKQFPEINEIARKFQNTDLEVLSIAVDRNIDGRSLINYLQYYQNIYFQPKYLLYGDGMKDLLNNKKIKYNNKIPFTSIINREGDVDVSFTGYKSRKFLTKKIIKFYK